MSAMDPSNLLWLASGFVLLALSVSCWRRLGQDILQTERQIHRCAVHQRELLRVIDNHRMLAGVQEFTETVVDGSTATIRSVHHEIANIPFDILEAIPATRDTTKLVRGVHDLTSDGIYGTISTVNRLLGKQLRKGMRVAEPADPGHSEPAGDKPDKTD